MNALDYGPPVPVRPDRGIGLIGCGWVAGMQLAAYRAQGYRVIALVDRDEAKATALRDTYYPEARVVSDAAALFGDPEVEVVDIATHPQGRPALVEAALRSGRHVLSQKPFVDDLDEGERLCAIADEVGRSLAVNHNGRWAPHFAVLLAAARGGVLGRVTSADFFVYWPHDEVVEAMPAFATMADLVLYDFGIHWFDVIASLLPEEPQSVYAQMGRRSGQRIPAPTQAQALVSYPQGQASLVLRAAEPRAERGAYRVDGTLGSVLHEGLSLGGSRVSVVTGDGSDAAVENVTTGTDWFAPGMAGTMGELLLSVDEGRRPWNDGRSALRGLALCFAAVESARTGLPVEPGTVRRRPVA